MDTVHLARRIVGVLARRKLLEFDPIGLHSVCLCVHRAVIKCGREPTNPQLAEAIGAALVDCEHVVELYASDDEIAEHVGEIRFFRGWGA